MDKYKGKGFRPGWIQVLIGDHKHLLSFCFSDLLPSVLASFSSRLVVVRWPPVAPGLFPVSLTTPVERDFFSLKNSKQIPRIESDSIGLCHVFIPEPITGAKKINYADWPCLSHMVSLRARG